MNSRLPMLLIIAGVQLLLTAGLLLASAMGSSDADETFLIFASDRVDRVVLEDGEGSAVTLAKTGDGWALGDGLPADDSKVAEVLNKLGDLARPWPVATTSATQERFEVSEGKHQRHVQLYEDEELVVDMYLGTSPGYRRVHAREVDDDDIFSVDFSNYELPAADDDWLDKSLLGAHGEVTEVVRVGGWRLNKGEEGWLLDDVAANQDAANKLTERFADLRIMGVVDDADAIPAEGVEHRATFLVSDADGQNRLEIYHRAEEDDYLLRGDRVAGTFTLASYIAEQLVIDSDDLLPEVQELPDEPS